MLRLDIFFCNAYLTCVGFSAKEGKGIAPVLVSMEACNKISELLFK